MKAMVCTRYGPPEVLQLQEVDKPVPRDGEVLVKIHTATVTSAGLIGRTGKPFFGRFVTGLSKPKKPILGMELSGEIEAVGQGVQRFKAGDPVFGTAGRSLGAQAEYIAMPEGAALVEKPANLTYEEAVAVVEGGLTALPFLRDYGHIQSGHKVLVNGASGSVGTAAVQLAKVFGAEVTGVCSTANLELVRSLGADRVIDYSQEDFTQRGETYDIILDAAAKSSFSRCKDSLAQGGVYLTTVPSLAIFAQMLWTSLTGGRKAAVAFTGLRPPGEKTKDLVLLKDLLEAGKVQPVIDRRFPLEQTVEANRYVEGGHKRGSVVITVA